MIVKSGARLMSSQLMYNADYSISIGQIKKIDGSYNQAVIGLAGKTFNKTYEDNLTGSSGGVIAFVGIGDTPVTSDDYFLDESTIGGVDVNSIVKCVSVRTNPLMTPRGISYLFVFMNSGDQPIDIKEICIALRMNSTDKYMIARKVIPTRRILPDETATFSYELDFY